MGLYFNTGIEKFNSALCSKIYIDKTRFLEYTNSVINTENRYLCISRPRRFGKSITAAMLSAYYGKNYDASALFANRMIAKSAGYRTYLNRYDVIEVDMNVFCHRINPQTGWTITACEAVSLFQKEVIAEIWEAYPDCFDRSEVDLPNVLAIQELLTGEGFTDVVFIPRQKSRRPAMVIELKYDQTAESAIDQIKKKKYTSVLSDYRGELLFVGITYDKKQRNILAD